MTTRFAKAIESVYNCGMATQTKRILPSEAAAALGSIKTPKKAASSAANGIKTRWQAKPLEALTCTCNKCPNDPKTYCPRGRAMIRRAAKEKAQANQAQVKIGGSTMTNVIEYSTIEANGAAKGEHASVNGAASNPLAAALALRTELAAAIKAGTHRTNTPLDAATELDTLRAQRFENAD